MKQITHALDIHRAAPLLFAAATMFIPTALHAGSCVVPDISKWHGSAWVAPPAGAIGLESVTQATRDESEQRVGTIPADSLSLLTINGLWKVTFYDGPNGTGDVVDVAFDAWSADGIEILNDYTPPSAGNVCLGTFTGTGNRSYRLTHPAWLFDSSGNPTGIEMLHENVTVSRDGNTLTGAYAIDFFDVTGTTSTGPSLTGSLKGARVKP